MNRIVREERGGVFVLSAFMIPVFLVLVALIFDVGTWYTHKRQLQNRADAGAMAAGVEYSTRWASCGGSLAEKTAAEGLIEAAARQYAGDPQQSGTLRNTELTEQTRINVEINSNAPGGRVDPDTSWNDPGGSNLGPCDKHGADPPFSPLPNAYYVDVGVRERDQRTLFGMFGLDLLRNEAHARVELKVAAAAKGFLPLAVADQDIRQAQIRYYRYCGSPNPELLGTFDLKTLGSSYQTNSGTTYWGPTLNNVSGGSPIGVDLPIPRDGTCAGGPHNIYMPVRAEVRIAGVDSNVINLNNFTCAQLLAMQYADCWDQVSDFSVDGDDPRSEPYFHEVEFTGGSSGSLCNPDAYFTKVSGSTTSCTYGISVRVDWNGLESNPPAGRHCIVSIGGSTLDQPGCPNGVWGLGGTNSTLGRSDVNLTWTCLQPDPNPPRSDIPCPGTSGATTLPVHSLFLGNRANSSLMDVVRTSLNPQVAGGTPGAELHWYPAPQGAGNASITVYPTVGLEGSLYVGQRRVLRAPHCKNNTNSDNCDLDTSSPNSSQSIDCEPGGGTGGQGHDFLMFADGCKPWYGPNQFTNGPWWNTTTNTCPPKPTGVEPNLSSPWSPNSQGFPRRCVVKAPGFSPNVIADGIASAIGNCSNRQPNSCQSYACNEYNFYDPSKPDEWALFGGKPSERVGFIFIVPYGAYKSTSSQETMPVLTFAAFYITGWEGKGSGANQNPCLTDPDGPGGAASADEATNGGDVVGYFVDYTVADAPGDPNANCVIGQITPCVPVLVR